MRLAMLLLVVAIPLAADTTIPLLHFSDYHSHARPFYSEGKREQGGIARAIGYLRREKRLGALVFSGGDMINKGSPAWSDKYGCAEWPWLNGIVDAMAFGNHDADYGKEAFDRCVEQLRYPVLSANTSGLERYAVFAKRGVRIGVFAVAGPDFSQLVRVPGITFTDSVAAAREVVRELRERERVDAVVMIGHQQMDADFALARAVPGIDVIFGTHSHHKQEAMRIDGTSTLFLSPFQYLAYISRVELTFDDARKLVGARGTLVTVDAKLPTDAKIAKRLAAMQRELERDPEYRALFTPIGTASTPLSVDEGTHRDVPFANLVLDVVREVSGADVALSTTSSFRRSLAPGTITMEDLRVALPYDNEILVYELTGQRLREVLAHSASRIGTDFFAQVSGVRFAVDRDHRIQQLALDPQRTYRVATTDYLARVAPGYRELFAGVESRKTGLRVREEVRRWIAGHSPVSAARDGRIDEAPQ